MKERKTKSKFTIFMLACLVLLVSVWAGRTYAYFAASNNATGTIVMGTLKLDKVTDKADVDTSLKVVPNQTVNRTYQATVKSDIKYYKRVCLTAGVDVVSGKTHKDGCGDKVADDMSILDMKITNFKSIVAEGVTYYYVLTPVTPSGDTTTEEFTINLTLKDWVGDGGCEYYMGATIELNVRLEVIQADYLEERGEATEFTDVQTMHDVWTSIFGGESGTPGDDEVHDVSYYSDELEFKVISENAKTMSVQAANKTSTASVDPVENTSTGLKKISNKNVGTSGSTLTIPSQVTKDGVTYTVTEIPDGDYNLDTNTVTNSAFYQGSYTKVILPDTLMKIGNCAFYNCSNLLSVNIPNNVMSIGKWCFAGCTSLLSITIPDNVISIGSAAFWNCPSMQSATIGRSVNSAGIMLFYGCSAMKTLTINSLDPNAIATIIQFNPALTALQNVSIPKVTGHFLPEYNALGFFDEYTGTLYSEDGIIFGINNGEISLISYPSGRVGNYTIPNNVINIHSGAFAGSKLTSITIPNNVKNMGDSAFSTCENLTSVNIGNSVTNIGQGAFDECTSLKSINIPGSVTNIGIAAFEGCTSLTSVTINNGVTSIEDGAFNKCSVLSSISIPDSVSSIEYDAFSNCPCLVYNIHDNAKYLGNDNNPYHILIQAISTDIESCEINSNCELIYEMAFYNCSNLTSISIPDSVINMGERAFYNCSSLESAVIGNNVASVKYETFGECTSLMSVSISNSVTSIGSYAFYKCINLTSIIIPNSVTSIYSAAFYGCSNLESITIPNSVTIVGASAFSACDNLKFNTYGNMKYLGNDTNSYYVLIGFSEYSSSGSYKINNSCKIIGDGAFYSSLYTSNLKAMYIPDSVTHIGVEAFRDCSSLTLVTMGKNIKVIGSTAFRDCTTLPSITIPSSVTSMGESVFLNCSNLATIEIEDGVTSIDDYAFNKCTGLTSITIPNSVTSIGQGAFSNCTSLTSITIPSSVKTIGKNAFDGCTSLTSVTFNQVNGWSIVNGESIDVSSTSTNATNFLKDGKWYSKVLYCDYEESIEGTTLYVNGNVGAGAYDDRTDITEVVFGDDVYSIGYAAFAGCTNLTTITLGKNITYIGMMAFSGTSITSVVIPASVKLIDAVAFAAWSENCVDQTLTEYVVETGNQYYKAVDGVLYSKDGKTLISYPYAKTGSSFTIPNGVTTIATGAFAANQYLKTITMPDSVTVAEKSSFFYLPNLESISISNNITDFSIGDVVSTDLYGALMGTMWYCIYNENFQFNIYENGLYLGNSTNPYLVLVYVEPTLEDGETALTSLVVHKDCKVIGDWAFVDLTNSITSISIPDGVEHIGEFAYMLDWICSYITYSDGMIVTSNLPTGLTYENNGLYLGSTTNPYKVLLYVLPSSEDDVLTEFTINSKCEIIGYGAFALIGAEFSDSETNLMAITTINIPASVKYIHTFGLACSTLKSITVDSDNKYFSATDGVLYSKDGKTLICYPSAKTDTSFTVSSNVTKIVDFAFLNNPNLVTLTIPDTVKSINIVSVGGNISLETINLSGDFMMTNLMGRFMMLQMFQDEIPTSEITTSDWILDFLLDEENGINAIEWGDMFFSDVYGYISLFKIMNFDRV